MNNALHSDMKADLLQRIDGLFSKCMGELLTKSNNFFMKSKIIAQ